MNIYDLDYIHFYLNGIIFRQYFYSIIEFNNRYYKQYYNLHQMSDYFIEGIGDINKKEIIGLNELAYVLTQYITGKGFGIQIKVSEQEYSLQNMPRVITNTIHEIRQKIKKEIGTYNISAITAIFRKDGSISKIIFENYRD